MRWFGLALVVLGALLLLASLGQYGFMTWRQHELRQQWSRNRATMSRPVGPADALRISIPSIHLDDAVVRGTSYEDLLVAPGLLEGSPLPARGGNTVIAGHRDTFFRHVAGLRKGDVIVLHSGAREFDYRVVNRVVVAPSDTAVLGPTVLPRLTLITCYPTYWIGPAPDRLVVQAQRFAIR